MAVGGGHGLSVTLSACAPWAGELTAVVSVADDGGSSGRIRAATGLPAPGDLRRCLTTLADPARRTLAAALERRFGTGDLAGHPAGNVLLAALAEETGELAAAVEHVAELLGVRALVVPATAVAVDLVAWRADGTKVAGQVAVEAAAAIQRVELVPPDPPVPEAATKALAAADLVVLGPGSLYGSVLAALAVPALREAVRSSPGRIMFVCNLRARAPETAGYDVAAHVGALARHDVHPEVVLTQRGGMNRGGPTGRRLVEADLTKPGGAVHDPDKLGAALRALA
ncbi:MAG: YvcK family protein [Acidimicrobiia bacterium]|nr:YvcK family protein [Acidimicrobiia bacterium]